MNESFLQAKDSSTLHRCKWSRGFFPQPRGVSCYVRVKNLSALFTIELEGTKIRIKLIPNHFFTDEIHHALLQKLESVLKPFVHQDTEMCYESDGLERHLIYQQSCPFKTCELYDFFSRVGFQTPPSVRKNSPN